MRALQPRWVRLIATYKFIVSVYGVAAERKAVDVGGLDIGFRDDVPKNSFRFLHCYQRNEPGISDLFKFADYDAQGIDPLGTEVRVFCVFH